MENLVHGVRHLLFLPGRNAFVGLRDDGLVGQLRGRKGKGVTSAQRKGLKIPYKVRKNKDSWAEAFPGLNPASSSMLMIQNFYIQPRPPDLPCPRAWVTAPDESEGTKQHVCFHTRFFLSLLTSVKWAQSSPSSSKRAIYSWFPLYFQNPFKYCQLCLWNIF